MRSGGSSRYRRAPLATRREEPDEIRDQLIREAQPGQAAVIFEMESKELVPRPRLSINPIGQAKSIRTLYEPLAQGVRPSAVAG